MCVCVCFTLPPLPDPLLLREMECQRTPPEAGKKNPAILVFYYLPFIFFFLSVMMKNVVLCSICISSVQKQLLFYLEFSILTLTCFFIAGA